MCTLSTKKISLSKHGISLGGKKTAKALNLYFTDAGFMNSG